MTALGLLAVGLIVGTTLITLYGLLDGLFGEWSVHAIFVVCGLLFVGLTWIQGPEATAANMNPWPYYAGLLIGGVIGYPIAADVRTTLEVNGEPRIKHL